MSNPPSAGTALYAAVACILGAISLWVGVVVIGLYYFAVDRAIPAFVDRIQVGMLVLAALCGFAAIALFVVSIVLTVRRYLAGVHR